MSGLSVFRDIKKRAIRANKPAVVVSFLFFVLINSETCIISANAIIAGMNRTFPGLYQNTNIVLATKRTIVHNLDFGLDGPYSFRRKITARY